MTRLLRLTGVGLGLLVAQFGFGAAGWDGPNGDHLNAGGGNWSTANYWFSNVVPVADENVSFAISATPYTVTYDGAAAVAGELGVLTGSSGGSSSISFNGGPVKTSGDIVFDGNGSVNFLSGVQRVGGSTHNRISSESTADFRTSTVTVSGDFENIGIGNLQLYTSLYGNADSSTRSTIVTGDLKPHEGAGLISVLYDSNNSHVISQVDGVVESGTNGTVSLLSLASGSSVLGGTAEVKVGGGVMLQSGGSLLLTTAGIITDPLDPSLALIQVDGPVTGAGLITASIIGTAPAAQNRIELNHGANTVNSALFDIQANAHVLLSDTYGPASKNNIANVDQIDMAAGSVLDVTGLDGGEFVLGRDQAQTLDLSNGGTVLGKLTVESGSTVTYATAPLTLAAGESFFNNGNLNGPTQIVLNGGTFGGTAPSSLPITINSGTLSPGASVGTTPSGAETWSGAFDFDFEISDGNELTTGSAGSHPGWDLLDIGGALTIESGVNAGDITFNLISSADGVNPGGSAVFNQNIDHTWNFVDYTSLVNNSGEAIADLFTLDTSAFVNSLNGTFAFESTGTGVGSLNLVYTASAIAVPEPSTWAIFGLLGIVGVMELRRRRRT